MSDERRRWAGQQVLKHFKLKTAAATPGAEVVQKNTSASNKGPTSEVESQQVNLLTGLPVEAQPGSSEPLPQRDDERPEDVKQTAAAAAAASSTAGELQPDDKSAPCPGQEVRGAPTSDPKSSDLPKVPRVVPARRIPEPASKALRRRSKRGGQYLGFYDWWHGKSPWPWK